MILRRFHPHTWYLFVCPAPYVYSRWWKQTRSEERVWELDRLMTRWISPHKANCWFARQVLEDDKPPNVFSPTLLLWLFMLLMCVCVKSFTGGKNNLPYGGGWDTTPQSRCGDFITKCCVGTKINNQQFTAVIMQQEQGSVKSLDPLKDNDSPVQQFKVHLKYKVCLHRWVI